MSTQPEIQSSKPQPTCLAMGLIADYAIANGWTPIGFRTFTVEPWKITVNGTKEPRENIPPFHALVEHQSIVALMLLNPFGGSVGGFQRAEDEFIADMQSALAKAESR